MRSTFRSVLLATALIAPTPLWAQTAPARDDDPARDTRDTIVVTGMRPATEATAGTKTDTPLVETPQSISVISSTDISNLGLENLNQALRYVAGVTPELRGANAEVYDQFSLRGFTVPRFLDGLKIFTSPTGYADTQIDVSRINGYDIVKGPASVLYGQSSPGGLVAITSKLPLQQDFYGAVSATYGSYDLYRLDADIGGMDGNVAYRLYGSVNGAHTEQTFGKRRRETVSGAVTIGGNGSTSLTLLGAYSHDPYNGDYGVTPASGTLFANPNGRIGTRFTASEPDDRFKREQAGGTYIARHDFGGGWAFRASGRYQYVSSGLGIIYTSGVSADPAQRIFGRLSYATREKLNSWTYDNQLTGHVETGALKHSLLFGADRQVSHSTEAYAFGSATPIDAFDPVYGSIPSIPAGDVAAVPDAFGGNSDVHLRQQGLYAQDQMALGGFRLTLSGRQDWARTQTIGSAARHDRKFTYRAGGLYLLPFGLAPYASYSTSFEPQSGLVTSDAGMTTRNASPTLGRQIEAGAKYQPPGTQILVTASWFRIEQTDVLTAIPLTNFSSQSGKVRSTGVEIEATAPLPHDFNAKLAFSRQKVRVVADEDPANVGNKLIGVGKGNAAAFLEWAPTHGGLDGFAVGGDVRHVDRVYGGPGAYGAPTVDGGYARGGYETPSYTVFDALLRYDLGKASPRLQGVQVQLNVANLFDRKYLTSCYLNYFGWCWYGNRRTIQGTIGFKW